MVQTHAPGRSIGTPFAPRLQDSRWAAPPTTQENRSRAGLTSGSPPDCGGRSRTSGGSQPPVLSNARSRSLVYGLPTPRIPETHRCCVTRVRRRQTRHRRGTNAGTGWLLTQLAEPTDLGANRRFCQFCRGSASFARRGRDPPAGGPGQPPSATRTCGTPERLARARGPLPSGVAGLCARRAVRTRQSRVRAAAPACLIVEPSRPPHHFQVIVPA